MQQILKTIKCTEMSIIKTSPDGAVAMSANGLVGTGFASRYRLQVRSGQVRVFNMHIQSKLL